MTFTNAVDFMRRLYTPLLFFTLDWGFQPNDTENVSIETVLVFMPIKKLAIT